MCKHGCRYLLEIVFLFSLCRHLEIELLKVILYIIVRGSSIMFSIVAALIYIPPTVHEGSSPLSTSCQHLLFLVSFK